ncbi:MAG: AAA family ATPase [Selenomonadaceae bacterium]|nr:AAA family ATPase [Selenomonadaceae bacterium]
MKRTAIYPFTAIVGQEEMKLSLILNAINPSLGGVLIKGEKGTAKSTAVRALAALLPTMPAVKGCRYHCDPRNAAQLCDDCRRRMEEGKLPEEEVTMKVIDLPVSATEDRVVGTLDIEEAIRAGRKAFEPGILAEANRNILYVDEVNLLEDHIVDVLLDAAVMGINTVEREGISFAHPAKFILVGTMNPEEGDIRPQLLDRFALSVMVRGEQDTAKRTEVIRRRLEYEADPEAFCAKYETEQQALTEKIRAARVLLPEVELPDLLLEKTALLSVELGVDGHRSDITLIKAALTHAAYAGRKAAALEDLRIAAKLVLPHRMRRRPFEDGKLDWAKVDELLAE